jgi:hypothetical protein
MASSAVEIAAQVSSRDETSRGDHLHGCDHRGHFVVGQAIHEVLHGAATCGGPVFAPT